MYQNINLLEQISEATGTGYLGHPGCAQGNPNQALNQWVERDFQSNACDNTAPHQRRQKSGCHWQVWVTECRMMSDHTSWWQATASVNDSEAQTKYLDRTKWCGMYIQQIFFVTSVSNLLCNKRILMQTHGTIYQSENGLVAEHLPVCSRDCRRLLHRVAWLPPSPWNISGH